MTSEWENPSGEEIVKQVKYYMEAIESGAEIGDLLCYSESAFKHLLGLGYFPGIKLTPEYQAKEVNARLAPKWPRIIREIRDTVQFNRYMERHDFKHPDHVSKYAGMPGLDAHATEVAYQLLLQSGRGTYKTPLAMRKLK